MKIIQGLKRPCQKCGKEINELGLWAQIPGKTVEFVGAFHPECYEQAWADVLDLQFKSMMKALGADPDLDDSE